MRWDDGRESDNVDDVRGQGGGGMGFGGGGGMGLLGLLPLLLRGGPIGIIVLIGIGLFMFGGSLFGGGGGEPRSPPGYQGQRQAQGGAADAAGDEDLRFVKVVAAFTEDTWSELFREQGQTYQNPRFTVYRGGTQTACGYGQTEMGPFYCPGDRKVYLDLGFFEELSGKFGAPGRFAQAYVIAHEVGHHVQNLLGVMDRREQGAFAGSKNEVSVRTELQADCYAGVWANRTNRDRQASGKLFLEPGDLESGLRAASAVGDDTLQRQARGRVVPDSFTHGASAQRVRWFKTGFDSGDPGRCDTFSESYGQL